MTNSLVVRIDLFAVNENGTIELIDTPTFLSEYPFTFQYKLYLPFEENEKKILKMFFYDASVNYEYSARLLKYFENRKALYDEVSKKYLPLVHGIQNSEFSKLTKELLIKIIDFEISKLYPYEA